MRVLLLSYITICWSTSIDLASVEVGDFNPIVDTKEDRESPSSIALLQETEVTVDRTVDMASQRLQFLIRRGDLVSIKLYLKSNRYFRIALLKLCPTESKLVNMLVHGLLTSYNLPSEDITSIITSGLQNVPSFVSGFE